MDQSRLRGVGAETESCTGSGEIEAGTFFLPGLRTSQATIGVAFQFLALAVALRVLSFDFVARLLIMS
jgi:hypothetical protein